MKVSPAGSSRLTLQATLLGALLLSPARLAFGNTPPGTPYVIEPAVDGQVVSPFDVHMETTPFIDLDAGDAHRCSEWEIWTDDAEPERVWATTCVTGTLRVHTHLGDGVFAGSYAGRRALDFARAYRLRVRHSDSSGDPATEWSPWGERRFTTEPPPPASVPGVTWLVPEPGYVVEEVAGGFRLPVNIAFVPSPGGPGDPLFYVSELYGSIKVVSGDGTVGDYAAGLLNFDPTGHFPGSGEQGVTGLAVEPGTGDVLAAMLYSDDPADETAPHHPKVVRFRSEDGGRTAAVQSTLFDLPAVAQGPSHQISQLTIAPDGALFVHMGDSGDITAAQDLDSFAGKILRMSLDGTALADNPFFDGGTSARSYVFASGFRNPFGGAWREADGSYYEVENGPSVDRLAKVVAGRNYGWDGSDASMRNFASYSWVPSVAPVNLAFVDPGTFQGSGFPPRKLGHAFVSESGPTWATGPQVNGKRISELELDGSGALASPPTTLVRYVGNGKGTMAGLAAGPDGLYFSELYRDAGYGHPTDAGARILRVRFVGAADFTADSTGSGTAWFTIRFTDRSRLPARDTWAWDFGDGGVSTERNPTHTYTAKGVYDVSLTVSGPGGVRTTRKQAFVGVGNVGLLGTYQDASDSGAPTHTRIDPGIDASWKQEPPFASLGPGPFSVTWTGEILPRFSEEYTLTVRCPSSVRLVLDGTTLLDTPPDGPSPRQETARVALVAGRRTPLELTCGGATLGSGASLLWQSQGQASEVIPAERLFPGPSDQEPPSAPDALVARVSSCDEIELSWGASSDGGGSTLAGYRLRRDGLLVQELPATARSAVDHGFARFRPHRYTVSAFDHAGNAGPESEPASVGVPCVREREPHPRFEPGIR